MPSKDVEMADVAEPAAEPEQREKGSSKEHKHKAKDKDRSKEHKHKSHKSSHKSKDKDRDRERDRSSERDRERRREDHSPEAAQPRDEREESPLEGDVPVRGSSAAAAEAAAPDVQPAAEQNGAAGAAEPAQQSNEGGEVSMSIEETNKMRVAMGLKPLKVEGSSTEEREAKERAAGKARAEAARKKVEDKELRERIETAKAKRKMEADLAKVTGLGEAKPEVDDVAAWVAASREAEAETKRRAEKEKAAKVASMYDEEDEDESDEEKEGRTAAELDGLKVAHSAEDLDAGETVILTLKDRNILEEGDDDAEELEDVLATEQRKREKARKAAIKPAVEYDEDGNAKGMLSKYDEEEEDAGFQIRAGNVIADEKARKAAEVRRKLAEGAESLAAGGPASFQRAADFYTKEEMAAFAKPKKRVKKKLRKKAAADDEEAVPSDTAAAVAALEEAAAAQAAASGGGAAGDHGSRRERGSARDADKAAAEEADAKRRRDRYDSALQKANYATLAASMAPDTSATGEAEEEDDDMRAALEASMRRSRSAAPQRRDADAIAAEIIRRRQQEEAQPATPAAEAGERLTEATEFARLVGQRDEGTAAGADDDAGGHMGVDAPEGAPAVGSKRKYRATKADEDEAGPSSAGADEKLPPPPAGEPPVKIEDDVIRERNIGKGVAGVLGLLKERGELNGKGSLRAVEWAGRTNDMKPVALQGLEDVYSGGRSANALENSVERALTRRDAHGRVLTPKEAFRDLCHHFHGIFPSKSNQERQMEKDLEAAAAKRAATSENPASLRRLQAAQKQAAAPYVVLSGSVRPGQTSDPTSGFATATGYQSAAGGGASVAPTPVLGGGKTPLVGDNKVKAMLGIKREGGASMPPPPSRQRKN